MDSAKTRKASNSTVIWSTNETSNTIEVSTAGTYNVTATDLSTGCSSQATTQLVVWQNPSIQLDSLYGICSAELPYSINPNAQGNGLVYNWSNGQNANNLNGSNAGSFELNVVDANGCQATAQTVVEILTSPNVNAGQDQVVCEDLFPITIAAAGSANSISWNTGSSAALLSVSSPGTYILTGTNANGCSAQDTVVITADPCLALQAQEVIFDVYPNPVSNSLFINASENLQNVALFSSEGKLMMHINQNSAFIEMDMSLLASGIYILEITTHSGTYTQRIVKQ